VVSVAVAVPVVVIGSGDVEEKGATEDASKNDDDPGDGWLELV
jgi:hypothetical protein